MKHARGFTLIELLVTVVIIGLLASIALPLSELATKRNNEQDLRRALREIREALDAYKRASDDGHIPRSLEQSGYPPTLATLVEGVTDAKSATGTKLRFLRRVPRDPLAPNPSGAPESSWGLRSYESPVDAPRPGRDVFDVYSTSAAVGLNGVPYKEW